MTDHDAAIIKAAETLASDMSHTDWAKDDRRFQPLLAAVAAKTEARKPKLLDAAEMVTLWRNHAPASHYEAAAHVLKTIHERAFAVIEGLPERTHVAAFGNIDCRSLSDIKRALGLSNG